MSNPPPPQKKENCDILKGKIKISETLIYQLMCLLLRGMSFSGFILRQVYFFFPSQVTLNAQINCPILAKYSHVPPFSLTITLLLCVCYEALFLLMTGAHRSPHAVAEFWDGSGRGSEGGLPRGPVPASHAQRADPQPDDPHGPRPREGHQRHPARQGTTDEDSAGCDEHRVFKCYPLQAYLCVYVCIYQGGHSPGN